MLHQEYEDWHKEYSNNDPIHLPFSIAYNLRELNKTKELIENKIANEIKSMRRILLENVPL